LQVIGTSLSTLTLHDLVCVASPLARSAVGATHVAMTSHAVRVVCLAQVDTATPRAIAAKLNHHARTDAHTHARTHVRTHARPLLPLDHATGCRSALPSAPSHLEEHQRPSAWCSCWCWCSLRQCPVNLSVPDADVSRSRPWDLCESFTSRAQGSDAACKCACRSCRSACERMSEAGVSRSRP
jgi:hypothetical protein